MIYLQVKQNLSRNGIFWNEGCYLLPLIQCSVKLFYFIIDFLFVKLFLFFKNILLTRSGSRSLVLRNKKVGHFCRPFQILDNNLCIVKIVRLDSHNLTFLHKRFKSISFSSINFVFRKKLPDYTIITFLFLTKYGYSQVIM